MPRIELSFENDAVTSSDLFPPLMGMVNKDLVRTDRVL